jgi:hypothetical protein
MGLDRLDCVVTAYSDVSRTPVPISIRTVIPKIVRTPIPMGFGHLFRMTGMAGRNGSIDSF